MKINSNFLNLHESYLFAKIEAMAAECQKNHPERRLIKLSIGDVTRPLAPTVVTAMKEAVEELANEATFHGYAPDKFCYGYDFLLEAIGRHYQEIFLSAGVEEHIETEEIFVSDGAKSDLGSLLDLFSKDNTVLLPDPVYPAYFDANVMDGRKIVFISASEENGFLPLPSEKTQGELIYLCSPNNPTGAVYSREQLKIWVDFARARGAVILFDAAYEAFVKGEKPRSIFEIEGARECAIEICSFSKTAGFTGVRCGYTVVPKELRREGVSLNALFRRRQTTKFNGASYIAQRGAAAALSEQGARETALCRAYYENNAKIIMAGLKNLGFWFTGGENSPYIWGKCPKGFTSMSFFRCLLEEAGVITTPGCGFGQGGEGYFRLTSFAKTADTIEAVERLKALF